MNEEVYSASGLADAVNEWCEDNGVAPVSGQAGEQLTERSIRFYRTQGLLDPPLSGGLRSYSQRHLLQAKAIRVLQSQGLPLRRIQELLYGRTEKELLRIEKEGVAELKPGSRPIVEFSGNESWGMTPLDEEFVVLSRRGRTLPPQLKEELLSLLRPAAPPRDSGVHGQTLKGKGA